MKDIATSGTIQIKASVSDWIKSRRSFYPKHFTGERIDDEVVSEVLNLANAAPTHKNTFPWRFKVYADVSKDRVMDFMLGHLKSSMPEGENREKKIAGFPEKKSKTSHLVAIIVHYDERNRVPQWEEEMAVACAVENIYLSLSAYGIGGYWSTGNVLNNPKTKEVIQLQENQKLLGFFYLGKIKADLHLPKREVPFQTIEWIK